MENSSIQSHMQRTIQILANTNQLQFSVRKYVPCVAIMRGLQTHRFSAPLPSAGEKAGPGVVFRRKSWQRGEHIFALQHESCERWLGKSPLTSAVPAEFGWMAGKIYEPSGGWMGARHPSTRKDEAMRLVFHIWPLLWTLILNMTYYRGWNKNYSLFWKKN